MFVALCVNCVASMGTITGVELRAYPMGSRIRLFLFLTHFALLSLIMITQISHALT